MPVMDLPFPQINGSPARGEPVEPVAWVEPAKPGRFGMWIEASIRSIGREIVNEREGSLKRALSWVS